MNKFTSNRPNLLDPLVTKKIIRTLNSKSNGHFLPVKNTFTSIYTHIILPNIIGIVVIFIAIIVLLYRYRITSNKRTVDALSSNIYNQKQYDDTDLLIDIYTHQKEVSREPKKKQPPQTNESPELVYPMYPSTLGNLEPKSKI